MYAINCLCTIHPASLLPEPLALLAKGYKQIVFGSKVTKVENILNPYS